MSIPSFSVSEYIQIITQSKWVTKVDSTVSVNLRQHTLCLLHRGKKIMCNTMKSQVFKPFEEAIDLLASCVVALTDIHLLRRRSPLSCYAFASKLQCSVELRKVSWVSGSMES